MSDSESGEIINVVGIELPKIDAERLHRWLTSEEGHFFWKYIDERKKMLHDQVCKEIGEHSIKDLLCRERLIGREKECEESIDFRREFVEAMEKLLTGNGK